MAIKILLLESDGAIRTAIKEKLLSLEEEVIIVEKHGDADLIVTNQNKKGEPLLEPEDIYEKCLGDIAKAHLQYVKKMNADPIFDLSQEQPHFVKEKKQNKRLSSRSKHYLKR